MSKLLTACVHRVMLLFFFSNICLKTNAEFFQKFWFEHNLTFKKKQQWKRNLRRTQETVYLPSPSTVSAAVIISGPVDLHVSSRVWVWYVLKAASARVWAAIHTHFLPLSLILIPADWSASLAGARRRGEGDVCASLTEGGCWEAVGGALGQSPLLWFIFQSFNFFLSCVFCIGNQAPPPSQKKRMFSVGGFDQSIG